MANISRTDLEWNIARLNKTVEGARICGWVLGGAFLVSWFGHLDNLLAVVGILGLLNFRIHSVYKSEAGFLTGLLNYLDPKEDHLETHENTVRNIKEKGFWMMFWGRHYQR